MEFFTSCRKFRFSSEGVIVPNQYPLAVMVGRLKSEMGALASAIMLPSEDCKLVIRLEAVVKTTTPLLFPPRLNIWSLKFRVQAMDFDFLLTVTKSPELYPTYIYLLSEYISVIMPVGSFNFQSMVPSTLT